MKFGTLFKIFTALFTLHIAAGLVLVFILNMLPTDQKVFGGGFTQNLQLALPFKVLPDPNVSGSRATSTQFIGSVGADANNLYDLGFPSYGFKDVYASGTIRGADVRIGGENGTATTTIRAEKATCFSLVSSTGTRWYITVGAGGITAVVSPSCE